MTEELKELKTISKLLVLLLMKNKVGQEEIARALGVDQSVISRMINPKNKSQKKVEKSAEESQDS